MKPQTIYLVKDRKDSEKFEWLVMNRMEFLIFLASPESKGRLFARLDKDPECPNIVYEASKSQYKKWRKAKRHKQYLSDCEEKLGITVVSLNALLFDTSINGESMLSSIFITACMQQARRGQVSCTSTQCCIVRSSRHTSTMRYRSIPLIRLSGRKKRAS